MEGLLDSGKWSDLTIRCQEKTWKVHCSIVLTQSTPLEAMMRWGTIETSTGIIDLPDDEPDIVEKMLRFLYQKDYDDERFIPHPAPLQESVEPLHGQGTTQATSHEDSNEEGSWAEEASNPLQLAQSARPVPVVLSYNEESLLINLKVYVIADKLDIVDLKKIATSKFETLLPSLWATQSFFLIVDLLYKNTRQNDRLLREVVTTAIIENITTLMGVDVFVKIMQEHGELAVDVLRYLLREKNDVDEWGTSRTVKENRKSRRVRRC